MPTTQRSVDTGALLECYFVVVTPYQLKYSLFQYTEVQRKCLYFDITVLAEAADAWKVPTGPVSHITADEMHVLHLASVLSFV